MESGQWSVGSGQWTVESEVLEWLRMRFLGEKGIWKKAEESVPRARRIIVLSR